MKTFSPQILSVAFVLFATALFAFISLLAKSLGNDVYGPALHPFQVSAGRFCFALITLLIIAVYVKPTFENIPWRLHLSRGFCGWLGVSFLFWAAILIPLADANAISFLSIIIAMILSVIFLYEKVRIKRWTAACLAFIGALVLVRPGTDSFQPASFLALASALFIGIEMILLKMLSDRETPYRILIINNSIGALLSLCVIGFVWVQPTFDQWIILISIGLLMLLVQWSFIQALKRMEASFVTPFWYATPAFAALFDFLLFNQHLVMTSVIGITLIMVGGIIICRRS